jgi:TRAP-type uncharacterized transport system substrate-binding protein
VIIPALSGRQQLAFWALLAVVAGAISWGVLKFVSPTPPRTLTMSTGAADGAYHQFAVRYQDLLRADGIALTLDPSTGSVENLERLNHGKTEVAFIQGGLGPMAANPDIEEDSTHLRALATVAYEPVWIFTRGLDLSNGLGGLAGRRVAAGAAGSGNARVAQELLRIYGVASSATPPGTQIVAEGGMAAAQKLVDGQLDAVILIAAPQAQAVRFLLSQETLTLTSLRHAQGLAQRMPYLRTVTLHRGSVDPAKNLPARDITLLATTANLVATDNLHPALASLLLQAAQQIHRPATLVSTNGEFPNAQSVDFPLAAEAERHFRDGRPFLQRYLPFWVANLVQRIFLLLLPLIAVLVPLFRILPPLLAWSQKHKLFRRYGELKFLERDMASRTLDEAQRQAALEQLDRIERDVITAKFPLDLADRVYTLRQHVDYVRSQLLKQAEAE